ncbi:MAG: 2-C-methyl-D-erythritol 2,4-cyclodiphosphate synthase [Thermodesulfovibrionales bacterium]|nr:2-C-methyl-D-erythritol 2,4-cyclodiphosphate synthase [Thermodesulfovibrionales bacterium]
MMRVGVGFDSHRLVEGRRLILGGVEIPFHLGLSGHSDGDVLIHAIIDAILGATGLPDIGHQFPDNEMSWKDASSLNLLKIVLEKVWNQGFEIIWIDSIIITDKPRLSPYLNTMKEILQTVGLDKNKINIKAKSNEGMGFIGRLEGIVAQAVCLVDTRR